MNTIEEFLMELKSIEVSAHIWMLETNNASEANSIEEFHSKLHDQLQELIEMATSDAGWKEHGFALTGFRFIPIDQLDIGEIIGHVKEFLQEIIRTPNGPFLPEIDAAMVRIISTLSKFNYRMMLE